ncbi:MAG: hypothetical protein ACKV2T_40705 [Kofleriaceae bacterium]
MKRTALGLCALAACGDGTPAPDALVTDADDKRGVVEVFVDVNDPFQITNVYFQERDSTLALATRLDQNGRARGYLSPHGFVTVIPQDIGGITRIYTYANVSPGDVLVVAPGGPRFEGTAFIRLRIPPLLGTQFYTLESPCNITDVSQATVDPILVDLTGCGAQTDFIVVARAPAGDVYLYANDVALSEAAPSTVSLLGQQYVPFEDSTVIITGITPLAERWYVEKGVAIGANIFHQVVDSLEVAPERRVSLTSLAPLPPSITSYTSTGADAIADPDLQALEGVIDWRPSAPQITIDLHDHDLRDQIAPARYIPGETSIQWAEATNGIAPNATVARLQWSTAETLYQWTLLGKRGDETRLDLPVLPGGLTPDPRSPPYELFRIAATKDAASVIDRLIGWTPNERYPIEGEAGTVVWQSLSQQ